MQYQLNNLDFSFKYDVCIFYLDTLQIGDLYKITSKITAEFDRRVFYLYELTLFGR